MRHPLPKEEEQCIQELRQGSEKAFNKLYRLYCRQVYAFVYQYTKIKEDTEDIVQETFVNVWKYRKNIRKEGAFIYLLFQIAKNLLINKMKSTIQSSSYEEYVALQSQLVTSNWESAHSRLEYEDFRDKLSILIRQCPKSQQRILQCRLLEELNSTETAQKLHLSEQTVRNQFSNGIKTIREKLRTFEKNGEFIWLLFFINLL